MDCLSSSQSSFKKQGWLLCVVNYLHIILKLYFPIFSSELLLVTDNTSADSNEQEKGVEIENDSALMT